MSDRAAPDRGRAIGGGIGFSVVSGLYSFVMAEIGLTVGAWVFGALAALCGAVTLPYAVVGLIRWGRDTVRWVRADRAAERRARDT